MIGSYIKFYTVGGSEGNTFTINDRSNHPHLWEDSPYYYISVTSVDGETNADVSYESHPIPNATGEKSGDVFRRGKTITLTGKINANSLWNLDTGAEYLKQMFNDTGLRKLVYKRLSDKVDVYYNGRINQDLTIVKSVENGKYEWDWVVGIRADDPRTYKLDNDSVYPTWQS